MKASELIERLTQLIHSNGDKRVAIGIEQEGYDRLDLEFADVYDFRVDHGYQVIRIVLE